MTTQLTPDELNRIVSQDTLSKNQTIHDPLAQKLLLCLLESVKGLTEEIKVLRKQNEEMNKTLQSLTTDYCMNYTTNEKVLAVKVKNMNL
jgi:hypothetical protein